MSIVGRLGRLAGDVRRRFSARGLVLMYHRVASNIVDPWRLCVTPGHFAEQLDVLARSWRPVALQELVEARSSRRAQGMVAITFDDGYADNLHAAAPILVGRGIPATFFLTSGMIGGASEFWWDELERLLLVTAALPPRIEVPAGRLSREFVTGAAAAPLPEPRRAAAAVRPWEAPADTRIGLFYAVWQVLRTQEEGERRQALREIRRQLGVTDAPRHSHRALSRSEALQLADLPGMAIGAHSVTHAALSARTPAEQLRELQDSKRDLEELIGRPVSGFAYPYGDHGPETLSLIEQAGFAFACTTEPGFVSRDAARFRLPRVAVEDWDGMRFAQRLAEALSYRGAA